MIHLSIPSTEQTTELEDLFKDNLICKICQFTFSNQKLKERNGAK